MITKPASGSSDHFGQSNLAQHRELGYYSANDKSFPTEYLRAVAAIASSDGILNVADFNALNEVSALMDNSALARVVMLEFVEHPLDWKTAFSNLHAASDGIDQATASEAFEAARSLLSIQGKRSRSMASSFAQALRYQIRPVDLETFSTDQQSLWSKVSLGSVRMIKGRRYVDLADLCVRATGDLGLASAVLECEQGTLDKAELSQRIQAACARASQDIVAFNNRIADFTSSRDTAATLLELAYGLQKQVGQRLAIADARIAFERESFDEDLEEAIHDAGNAFEREVTIRLNTDQWKRAAVWEDIAKSTFGKELERRVSRIVSRRERALQLIHDDLRLFQEEMALSRSTILKRLHHTELARSAPALRWSTRFKNGTEGAANMTLTIGGVAAIGTGAAAYFLGAAAVMPVVVPAAPFVGGALLVAGVFKWMMNPSERKRDEVGHHREAFEKAFRIQLQVARKSLVEQLDATALQFHQAAEQTVQPIILEAQATDRLAMLHLKMARRLNDHSQRALADMMAALPD